MAHGVRSPRSSTLDAAALLCAWPAILFGAFIASRSDVSPLAFAPNAAAALLGSGVFVVARNRAWSLSVAAACGGAFLVATLAFGGMDGVRRWLFLGPVTLHVSSVVSPLLLAHLALTRRDASAIATVTLGALVHALQPDAGQATAFAAAALAALAARTTRSAPSLFGAFLAIAGAAVACVRHDPLEPVDHVERILVLAAEDSPIALIGALVALAVLFTPFVVLCRRPGAGRGLAIILAVYFAGALSAPAFGDFPVPLLGAGAGPVLGWFAAMIALASVIRGS